MEKDNHHLTDEEVNLVLDELFQSLRRKAEELKTKRTDFVSVINPVRTQTFYNANTVLRFILNDETDVELLGGENGSTYGDIRLSGNQIVVYDPQTFLGIIQSSDVFEALTHTDGAVEINLSYYNLSTKQTIE